MVNELHANARGQVLCGKLILPWLELSMRFPLACAVRCLYLSVSVFISGQPHYEIDLPNSQPPTSDLPPSVVGGSAPLFVSSPLSLVSLYGSSRPPSTIIL